jgi:hypothetical protein
MATKTDELLRDLKGILESEQEDVGDLLREVMRWLKKDQDVASHFANRTAKALKDAKMPDAVKSGVDQVWDVLSNLTELLATTHAVARDAMQMTAFGEGKVSGPPEMVRSLGRWLKGAMPAVSAYTKKVNDSVGLVNIPKDAQTSYAKLANLLRDLQRTIQEIEPLVKEVSVLDVES